MRINLKQTFRNFRRSIWAPFKNLLRKAKRRVQDFVVQTVAASDLRTADSAASHNSELPNYSPFDTLFLAYLKAGHRATPQSSPIFQAVPVGEGRLLVGHPLVGFLYINAYDLRHIPSIVVGRYQESQTMMIEREIRRGEKVLHLGAEQGYHTLSLTKMAGEDGRILAVEWDDASRGVLEINIRAHGLERQVRFADHRAVLSGSLAEVLRQQAFEPTVVYLTAGAAIPPNWIADLEELMRRKPALRVIAGSCLIVVDSLLDWHRDQDCSGDMPTRLAA